MSIMLIMQGAAGRAKPSFEPVFHDRLRINGALDDADDDDPIDETEFCAECGADLECEEHSFDCSYRASE